MRGWRRVVRPAWVPSALFALGGVLIGVILGEVVVWVGQREITQLTFVAGVLTSLPFAATLTVGAYWLPTSSIAEDRYPDIAVWSLAGLVFFGSFFAVLGNTWFGGDYLSQLGMVRWGTAVGAGGGFVLGTLNARRIDRAVDAERATVRAEEARRQQQLLEYLNAVLRHEVLNTANVVSGYAELVGEELEDEDLREQIGVIERQTEELEAVITDVRVLLSAVEDGEDLEPIHLPDTLAEEVRKLRDRHDTVAIETDLPDTVYVRGDDMLHRIFSNLLANAVEHNRSDPPRVAVAATTEDDTVAVTVADNGPGIPEGMQEGLFDPVPDMDADHGLGMTIVTRLVDRYDGAIELTDTGEDGTTFTVTLPRADPPRRPG